MELLTAIKFFPYAGKALKPNDDFEATAAHARLLIALGKAKPRVADVELVEQKIEPKRKRQYRRKDMVAE